MTTTENKIRAKVQARNLSSRAVMETYNQLVEIFRPLVGQQITKKNGTLLEKIKKTLPELESGNRLSIYFDKSDYSLKWACKACVMIQDGCSCVYDEQDAYIGHLVEGVLGTIQEPEIYRTDWTVEEVTAKIEAVGQKERELREAKSALCGFDLY